MRPHYGRWGRLDPAAGGLLMVDYRSTSTLTAAAPGAASTGAHAAAFHHSNYLIRRKVLSLFGAAFHIYDGSGHLAFYSKQKAFKLKEDIRLYTGEDMKTEVLTILARQVIDFSAGYDVIETATQSKIGALRRKGMKSIFRDEWTILDAGDMEIGVIREDSTALALIRRFVTNLVPQKFRVEVRGQQVGRYKQHFNPFVLKINMDFSMDQAKLLDRRLGIAAAVLLSAIEGHQG
jgi:uncharacterized protein YxjI